MPQDPRSHVLRLGALAAGPGDLSDRKIEHTAALAASPRAAWGCWADSEALAEWLVHSSNVEMRIGGAYEFYFAPDAPEGSRGGEGCRVLSFVPGRSLSFTWNAPPSLPKTREQRTWVSLDFAEIPGGTRLTLIHLGWPASGLEDPGSQWPETFAYFDATWGRVLTALTAYLGAV